MNPGLAAQKHSPTCDLVSDSLRLFGTLQLKVIGWSMLPTLWPGDTIVVSTTDFSQIVLGETENCWAKFISPFVTASRWNHRERLAGGVGHSGY
jgi:hypothetical protein